MASNMTISQALRRIKRLKGLLAAARDAQTAAITHRADSPPVVSWETATTNHEQYLAELIRLQTQVAIANASTTVVIDGKTLPLCGALKILAELKDKLAWLSGMNAQRKTKEFDVEDIDLVWIDDKGNELNDDEIYEVSNKRRIRKVRKTPYICSLIEADRLKKIENLQSDFDTINSSVEDMNHKTVLPALPGSD